MLRAIAKSFVRCSLSQSRFVGSRKCLSTKVCSLKNSMQALVVQPGQGQSDAKFAGFSAFLPPNYNLKVPHGSDIREQLFKAQNFPETAIPRFNLNYIDQGVKDLTSSIYEYCIRNVKDANRRPSIWHIYGPRGSGRTRFAFETLPMLQKLATNAKDNAIMESAKLTYINMEHGRTAPGYQNNIQRLYKTWSNEHRLALHLLNGYYFPFLSIVDVANILEEKHIIPSLESALDLICAEPNPPKVLQIVFDDCDDYIDYSRKHVIKEFMKLLTSVQSKYTALTIVPMFITVQGPSLIQKYLQVSTCTVNNVQMKPMGSQALLNIIPHHRLNLRQVPVASDARSYLFLLDGNPGLAVMLGAGFTSSSTKYDLVMARGFYEWQTKGGGVFAYAAMTGYPIDPSIRCKGWTVKDAIKYMEIFRHQSIKAFGDREILTAPIVALSHVESWCEGSKSSYMSQIYDCIQERGSQWFEQLCCYHLALRFSVAHAFVKRKSHIGFIDLFGDAFASNETKQNVKLHSEELLFHELKATSFEELDMWLEQVSPRFTQIRLLAEGHENTAVLRCYRAEDLRPCWIWIRVVKKNKNDPLLNPNEVRQTIHPSIPCDDQFTLVVSNGQAFADLTNVIGTQTVVICDDNLSTSFSAVLAPLIRNLELWEQLKDSKE